MMRKTDYWVILLLIAVLLAFTTSGRAQETLKPGEVIGPNNAQKVKDMAGPTLLKRVQEGYTFTMGQPQPLNTPAAYIEATKKYSAGVKISPKDELADYVAGLPFPNIDPKDPKAGLKVMYNFYWRYNGDTLALGHADGEKVLLYYPIERSGDERHSKVIFYRLNPTSRIHSPPSTIPGYEGVDNLFFRMNSYPRDLAGTTFLIKRYRDADRADDLWIYFPSLRRIRRFPTTQRCATIAPGEFNLDDVFLFDAKVTSFNYKLLGERKILTIVNQKHHPYKRKHGDFLPQDELWQALDGYAVEITSKDPNYCYPKKIMYIEKTTWAGVRFEVYDKKGDLWKEAMGHFKNFPNGKGEEALGFAGVWIKNNQNGRSTVLETGIRYNIPVSPEFFSLATLEKATRGDVPDF